MAKNLVGKCISKRYVTETIIELGFEIPPNLEFIPGQFANFTVKAPFKRAYSVLEYTDDIMKIIVEIKEPGLGSDFFRNMQLKDTVIIEFPLGKFVYHDNSNVSVFISTGAGIAPFVPILKNIRDFESKKIILLQGMSYLKDDIAFPYLKNLIISNKIQYYRCITKESIANIDFGVEGRVTVNISNLAIDLKTADFYISGGKHVIDDVKNVLKNVGAGNVYIENYG